MGGGAFVIGSAGLEMQLASDEKPEWQPLESFPSLEAEAIFFDEEEPVAVAPYVRKATAERL